MRVGLVVSPYGMSGLSRYALELSESLPRQNVDVEVIEARLTGKPLTLANLFKKLGPDLATFLGTHPIHIPMNHQQLYHLTHAGLATSLYLSRANHVVITVHDIIHYIFRHDNNLSTYQNIYARLADTLALKALRRASAIIAISEYTKSTLVDYLNLDPAKIHVVHRSVNLDRFHPMEVAPDFWQRHALDPSCRYILHLSSDEYRKNVPTLIRAFAQAAQDYPDLRLLKIGRSQYAANRQRLVQLVSELGLEDRVIFIDYVTDEDLPRFYNISEIFILPSLYEGFGLPVLEAMACGCPVICSNRPPLSTEIVADAGVLVEPSSENELPYAVCQFLQNDQIREAFSQKGLKKATEFSSVIEARKTKEVYTAI